MRGFHLGSAAMPSTVWMFMPSHSAASIWQESTGRPSMITVQEPQAPRSHMCLAPVRPSLNWRACFRVHWGSSSISQVLPFTVRVTVMGATLSGCSAE